jgi:hypothetical protein
MRQQIQCIFLSVTPFFISVGGFVGALRFLQSPSNGEIMGVFLAAILGAMLHPQRGARSLAVLSGIFPVPIRVSPEVGVAICCLFSILFGVLRLEF